MANHLYDASKEKTTHDCMDAGGRATQEQLPKKPPVLQEMTRMLAQLGGFLARKRDGEPGAKTIWLGYQKLIHYIDALETVARV